MTKQQLIDALASFANDQLVFVAAHDPSSPVAAVALPIQRVSSSQVSCEIDGKSVTPIAALLHVTTDNDDLKNVATRQTWASFAPKSNAL